MMMGGFSLFRKPTIENITASSNIIGGGAVISAPVKYAIALGGGAVAGMLLNRGVQQDLSQYGKAETGGYTIYAYPDSQVTLKDTTTGVADVDQDQDAKTESPNYLQWALIGGLALAGLYIWKKVR